MLCLEERINFEYETLFETGVDEMSWDDTVSDLLELFSFFRYLNVNK